MALYLIGAVTALAWIILYRHTPAPLHSDEKEV